MIRALHHIAIVGYSEDTIVFYKTLGFRIDNRRTRTEHGDELVWMKGFGLYLELFLHKEHPARAVNPENYGLSHIAFFVNNLDSMIEDLSNYKHDPIIVGHTGMRTCFVYDPNGTPVELKEVIENI